MFSVYLALLWAISSACANLFILTDFSTSMADDSLNL